MATALRSISSEILEDANISQENIEHREININQELEKKGCRIISENDSGEFSEEEKKSIIAKISRLSTHAKDQI